MSTCKMFLAWNKQLKKLQIYFICKKREKKIAVLINTEWDWNWEFGTTEKIKFYRDEVQNLKECVWKKERKRERKVGGQNK